ncbi:Tetratricopeptide repeat protein 28 [Stylophora pistillata]|uniref:Tetratricopeptide repeat protein 28 n=1 Tax=Stylophora pistillata TaxID=50429 RepID=A0A2B4R861_STYPI|nr:Tetratricopeptide repeat protein 28 [Stylophora pistillata]
MTKEGDSLFNGLMAFAPKLLPMATKAVSKILPGLATGALTSLEALVWTRYLDRGRQRLFDSQSKIDQLIQYKSMLTHLHHCTDVLAALQSAGDVIIKPPKTQRGGAIGTISASFGIPLLMNTLTGKGMQNKSHRSAPTAPPVILPSDDRGFQNCVSNQMIPYRLPPFIGNWGDATVIETGETDKATDKEKQSITEDYDYCCSPQENMTKAQEYLEKALTFQIEIGDMKGESSSYEILRALFQRLGKYEKAHEYLEKAFPIQMETGDRKGVSSSYANLGTLFLSLGKYVEAQEYLEKALTIQIEIGDSKGESSSYGHLEALFQRLSKYGKAQEYLEKALPIQIEIGDRRGESSSYANLGTLFLSLSKYVEAREHLEKALTIQIEIGDRNGKAKSYGSLGILFQSLGKSYEKAQEYLEKALPIQIEIGDKNGEVTNYGNLGKLFRSVGKYEKVVEYLEKALTIQIEIGYRSGEATVSKNLGNFFLLLGKYEKAREYLEKALTIQIEIGDRNGEASSYGNLGNLFQSLGKYKTARQYLEKALTIQIEIGDSNGEASNYGNLGAVFLSLSNYKKEKARKYLEKAFTIQKEIGDRSGEASNYLNLGGLFRTHGDYSEAQIYLEKALQVFNSIGQGTGKAAFYGNLASLFLSPGKYGKVEELLEKASPFWREIGDRQGEARHLENLGNISHKREEYDNALEYFNKAFAIDMEIGRKDAVVVAYANEGTCFQSLDNYDMAEEYFKEALTLSEDIGHKFYELKSLCNLSVMKLAQFDTEEACSFLIQSNKVFDTLRGSLKDSDQFKTLLLETHSEAPYKSLSWLLSKTGRPQDALYVEELRRPGNPKSWRGIQNIVVKETDSACLYISVGKKDVRYWILEATGAILFTEEKVSLGKNVDTGFVPDLDEFFTKSFHGLGILPEQNCGDRSLDYTESMSPQNENRALLRDCDDKRIKKNLDLCYKIIVAPVADLLKKPEIIIVPDSCMYQVQFAALTDEEGKYLSESFKLRIVPSLTTLKLIQDSQTGALIVGDPEVGEVILKGRRRNLPSLPCARKEAQMIGRLLGVTPLIGKDVTKQVVLQAIHSVSLIHLAAHGHAERGEIVLSPDCPADCVPRDDVYLLTMADISQIKLRAKLVVLSCCHSARGDIKAEGVIGITRAFLGPGARSVLTLILLCYIIFSIDDVLLTV